KILSISDILDGSLQFVVRIEASDVAAFRPPVLAIRIELRLQRPRRPSFQINANLLGIIDLCRDDGMSVIGPAIDCVKNPTATGASLRDLSLDASPLVGCEDASVLSHPGSGFDLANRI